jgi:uncharacterized phiE125 gp8 family phage protein
MTWTTAVIVPPSQEPVTIEQARRHLRATADEINDVDAADLIKRARQLVEDMADRALMDQTRALYLDGFPAGEIRLPGGVVSQIDSITYTDPSGASQTVYGGDWVEYLHGEQPIILPVSYWPNTLYRDRSVTIQYRCGWLDVEDVPGALVSAVLLVMGWLYDDATGEKWSDAAVINLVRPYRRVLV